MSVHNLDQLLVLINLLIIIISMLISAAKQFKQMWLG